MGRFCRQSSTRSGAEPVDLVAGDLSGNGYTDLVTANRSGGDLTILWATAGGIFTPQTVLYGGHAPTALAVGDFNGDGKIDLAVADGDDISWRATEPGRTHLRPCPELQRGSRRRFPAAVPPYSPQPATHSVRAAKTRTTWWFLFNADGSLENRVSVSLEYEPDGLPVIGEFDSDGFHDVAYPVWCRRAGGRSVRSRHKSVAGPARPGASAASRAGGCRLERRRDSRRV